MEELNKGYKFTKAQIAELESLRAWKAEIEKQEPVAEVVGKFLDQRALKTLSPLPAVGTKLYAAPVVNPDVEMLELCIIRWKGLYKRESDLYDKLNNENQSLKTELDTATIEIEGLTDKLEAARSSRAKDALDAERYRWMRSYRPGLWLDGITLEPIENEGYALQLDFAIDSAIEQAKSCNELHEKGGVK